MYFLLPNKVYALKEHAAMYPVTLNDSITKQEASAGQ